MPVPSSRKEELIDELLQVKRQAQRMELSLRFQGKNAEADEVRASWEKLSAQIDALLGALMKQWSGKADDLAADFRSVNARMQRRVRDVRGKIDVANKVVDAIGLIDQAASRAADLLGP